MAEPRDTLKLLAVPRLMFAAIVIWTGWYTAHVRHRPALGTVVVEGTQFAIDGCKKMPAGPDVIGADLRASDRNVVRVVRDARGVRLSFYSKDSDVAIPIDVHDCSQRDIEFSSEDDDPLSPATGNPVIKGAVRGNLNFTCTVAGRKIDAAVFFEHCGP